jgi:hypothetical protein
LTALKALHPHRDCTARIVVVHNGVVENYLELKREPAEKGQRICHRDGYGGHRSSDRTGIALGWKARRDHVDRGASRFEAVLHSLRKDTDLPK